MRELARDANSPAGTAAPSSWFSTAGARLI